MPARLSCAVLAALCVSPAWAADDFMACGEIVADAERLACYDAVYRSRSETAVAAPAATSPTAEQARPSSVAQAPEATAASEERQPSAEDRFGLPREPDPDELTVLRSSLVRVSEASSGRAVFHLQNGQVWAQSESHRARIPEPPLDVEIRPGRFGAFFMQLGDKGVLVKVKRIR